MASDNSQDSAPTVQRSGLPTFSDAEIVQKIDTTAEATAVHSAITSSHALRHEVYKSPDVEPSSKRKKIDPVEPKKLEVIFFKNEYIAVRSLDNGYYLCQTNQNVYEKTSRFSIRWFSLHDNNTDLYYPDYHDKVNMATVLTNVNVERKSCGNVKLCTEEIERVLSILNEAIETEQGVLPPLEGDHSDGSVTTHNSSEGSIIPPSVEMPLCPFTEFKQKYTSALNETVEKLYNSSRRSFSDTDLSTINSLFNSYIKKEVHLSSKQIDDLILKEAPELLDRYSSVQLRAKYRDTKSKKRNKVKK